MMFRYAALVAALLAGGCSGGGGDDAAAVQGPAAFVADPVALPNGTQYTAVVAEGAKPEALTAAAQAFCGDKGWCQVMAWKDAANVPRQMPMLEREADSVAFSYMMNRASGSETVMWDCRVWPGAPEQCIAGGAGGE